MCLGIANLFMHFLCMIGSYLISIMVIILSLLMGFHKIQSLFLPVGGYGIRGMKEFFSGFTQEEHVQFILMQDGQFSSAWTLAQDTNLTVRQRREVLVGQVPLGRNQIKLNTDSTFKGNLSLAGGGGLIRDFAGVWLLGFVVHIGFCSLVATEFWILLIGLQQAQGMGYHQVIVEVDSLVVIHLLHSETGMAYPCYSIYW